MEYNGRTFFLAVCMKIRERRPEASSKEVEALANGFLAYLAKKVKDEHAEAYFDHRSREILAS